MAIKIVITSESESVQGLFWLFLELSEPSCTPTNVLLKSLQNSSA